MDNLDNDLQLPNPDPIPPSSKKWYRQKGLRAIIVLAVLGAEVSCLPLADNLAPGGINPIEASKLQTNPEREEFFARLTRNSWCNRHASEGSMFPDYTDYKFKPDGTYQWVEFTDYTPPPGGSGKWNFEQDASSQWFLLYDNGQRQRFSLNKNGSLTLEGNSLDPCDPIAISRSQTAENLPPIRLSSNVEATLEKLTANRWRRANDFDLEFEPTHIEFKKDYAYIATYRNGQCQNSGSWSATANEIKGNSLTDKCDPRDDTYPESITAKLLDNGFLFFDYDLYVPANYPLKRGIIWSVFGHSDVVNIKVEYDMPIKAGVLNRFDVEMTNVGERQYPGVMFLQRLSLTHDFVRNYRQSNETIAHVKELAGKDLGSIVLKPGETYKLSLDVTFDKPGKQPMYLNSFILGTTQTWDTHQLYQLVVQ